jgi:putative transposase
MSQSKTERQSVLVDEQSRPEVVSFRARLDQKSPLDELVREGARRMLQSAIDAEVEAFIAQHEDRRDDRGRRLVVKNGSLPEREILTGAGAM